MAPWNPRKKGEATLLIPIDELTKTIQSLPKSYSVIGSRASDNGLVALRVRSNDICGENMVVKTKVEDAGSTRTLRIIPCGEDI